MPKISGKPNPKPKPRAVPKGRPARHPWEKWFRAKTLVLTRKVDFQCEPYSLGIQFRNRAAAMGILLSVQIMGNKIRITNHGKRKESRNASRHR